MFHPATRRARIALAPPTHAWLRMKKSMFVKEFARFKGSKHFTPAVGALSIIVLLLVLSAAAMLGAGRQSRGPADRPAPAANIVNARTETAAPAASAQKSAITITGCLERKDDTFRLKDTTGANAPKSRSWKSGFLKKGSASIEVVDAANRVKLPNHVGRRVAVTGTLVDREMQVRSLQLVAASCNQKA